MNIKKHASAILFFLALILPQLAQAQNDSAGNNLNFDFGITRGKNINAWPLIKKYKDAEHKEMQLLFSIYGYNKSLNSDDASSHLFPLYWKDRQWEKSDFRLLSLYYPSLFRYTKNISSSSFKFLELAPKISLLDISSSKDGMQVENNLLFFLLWKNNQLDNKKYIVALPLFYWYDYPTWKHCTLFPLYSRHFDVLTNSSYRAITPLFWHIGKEDRQYNYFAPFFYQEKWANHKKTVFFPLYWAKKEPNYKSRLLFPLFLYQKEKDRSFIALTPLFGRKADSTQRSHYLLPFYFRHHYFGKGDQKKQNYFFPIFWTAKRTNNNDWSQYKSIERHSGAFPLLWFGYDSTIWAKRKPEGKRYFTIFPLYWHTKEQDEAKTVIFPLMWNRHDSLRSRIKVFPLFSIKKQEIDSTIYRKKYFFPTLWLSSSHSLQQGGENYEHKAKAVLFPLVWYSKDSSRMHSSWGNAATNERKLTVFPLLWHKKDNDLSRTTLFPLVWSRRDSLSKSLTLLPLFSYTNNQKTKESLAMGGLLYWHKKTPAINNTYLFPLFARTSTPEYKSLTLFPLYSAGKAADSSSRYRAITPLWWHLQYKTNKIDIVFPLYWSFKDISGRDTAASSTIFPFWWHTSTIHANGNADSRSCFFPLYWGAKGNEGARRWKSSVFFPLYWRSTAYLNDTLVKSNFSLFPFYYRYRSPEISSGAVFPFYIYRNISTLNVTSRTSVYSLLYVRHDYNQGKDWRKNRFLIPFYWQGKQNNQQYSLLLPFYYSKQITEFGDSTRISYIFPFYTNKTTIDLKTKALSSKSSIFPLIYWGLDKNGQQKENYFTAFPLIWTQKTWQNDTLEQKRTTIFPLYYSYWRKNKSFNAFFPLWTSYKKIDYLGDTTRLRSYSLLLWNHSSGSGLSKHRSTFLFPIFWRYNTPEWKSTALIPLYAYGRRKDSTSRYLSLGMIFWNRNKTEQRTSSRFDKDSSRYRSVSYQEQTKNTVLFPILWRKTKYEEAFKSKNRAFTLFPLFWYRDKLVHDTVETRSLSLFPLLWLRKGYHHSSSVLFPLFWRYKTPEERSLLILPLYYSSKTKHQSSTYCTPFWIASQWRIGNYISKKKTVFPFYISRQETDSAGRLLKDRQRFGLLLWKNKDTAGSSAGLMPLIWQKKTRCASNIAVLPLFVSRRNTCTGSKLTMATPLIWSSASKNKKTLNIIPLFHRSATADKTAWNSMYFVLRGKKEGNERSLSALWPLLLSKKTDTSNYWHIAPILWRKRTEHYKMFSFQPLFFADKQNDTRRFMLFWQLYQYERGGGLAYSHRFLWQAYNKTVWVDGDYSTRLLYRLYANVQKDGTREKCLFPLYYSSSKANGELSKNAFFGFYSRFKQQVPNRSEFYEEERIFWFMRLRSNYQALKQKGINMR